MGGDTREFLFSRSAGNRNKSSSTCNKKKRGAGKLAFFYNDERVTDIHKILRGKWTPYQGGDRHLFHMMGGIENVSGGGV